MFGAPSLRLLLVTRSKILGLPGPPPGSERIITKEQIICSELSRAIRLFIDENDLVCAHLLAGAAADNLRQLAKKSGKRVFRDDFNDRILPQHRSQIIDRLSTKYNFLKHVSNRTGHVWDRYHPTLTEYLLFECCVDFEIIFGVTYFETRLYLAWFSMRHRDILVHGTQYTEQIDMITGMLGNVTSDNLHEATRELAEMLKLGAQVSVQTGLPVLAQQGVEFTPDHDSSRNPEKR
jgi:hypothetical protein